MRSARWIANIAGTLCLWLLIMKLLGSISFTPTETNILVNTAAKFHIYGDERIEDFYMAVTTMLALLIAICIVWLINRFSRMKKNERPV